MRAEFGFNTLDTAKGSIGEALGKKVLQIIENEMVPSSVDNFKCINIWPCAHVAKLFEFYEPGTVQSETSCPCDHSES